jgi:hypothetical protein
MIASSSSSSSDGDGNNSNGFIEYRPRGYYEIKNHPLSGITFVQWAKLLRTYWRFVDFRKYFPRIIFLTMMSMFNQICFIIETIIYGRKIAKTKVQDDPVIIVGHPRTGTTHLHNLLTLDEERFYTCTTFDVGFPSSFLIFPKRMRELLKMIMDDRRPMDNMYLAHDTPQEDEVATNQLCSCLASPYAPLIFPNLEESFRPFYSLDSSVDAKYPCSLKKLALWRDSFWYFVKKITFANNRGTYNRRRRRLVLKSPVHMARLKLLSQMFPRAQFLVCHRNPYETFQSAANMADKYYWNCFLHEPTKREKIEEFIFRQGEILTESYEKEIRKIDAERVIEVPFAKLDSNPLDVLEKIYESFGFLDDGESKYKGSAAELKAREYIESSSLKDFKKNSFEKISNRTKKEIEHRWTAWFRVFDYRIMN